MLANLVHGGKVTLGLVATVGAVALTLAQPSWAQFEGFKVIRGGKTEPAGKVTPVEKPAVNPLVQRCLDPAVQDLLKPFLDFGYWQPVGKHRRGERMKKKRGENSYTPGPISYTALRQSGALAGTTRGLRRLVWVATNGRDKSRTRWPFRMRPWYHEPEELVFIQGLLIELGPTMVELGMLAE